MPPLFADRLPLPRPLAAPAPMAAHALPLQGVERVNRRSEFREQTTRGEESLGRRGAACRPRSLATSRPISRSARILVSRVACALSFICSTNPPGLIAMVRMPAKRE